MVTYGNLWRAATLVLVLLPAGNFAYADKKDELDQLRERIGQLQRDLAKSEESRSEVADALRNSEKAVSEVSAAVAGYFGLRSWEQP